MPIVQRSLAANIGKEFNMEFTVKIDDFEKKQIIADAVDKAINETIYPQILEYVKKAVSTEAVGELILKRINECFEYSSYNPGRSPNSIGAILEERVKEIAARITDEQLKNAILNKFISASMNRQ